MTIQERIRANQKSKKIVVGYAGNKCGIVMYDPIRKVTPENKDELKPQIQDIPDGMSGTTAAMATVAAIITEEAKNANGQRVDIYCPPDTAIRIRGMFSRIDGEDSLTEADLERIQEIHSEDAEAYVSACDAAFKAIKAARAAGRYVKVYTLDDMDFRRLPEDIAKNWKLSGIDVSFKNGKATIPAGSKMSDGTLTTAPIAINGNYIQGRKKLSVRRINHSDHKELVALIGDSSVDIQTLRGMKATLFAAMPTEVNAFAMAYRTAKAQKAQA